MGETVDSKDCVLDIKLLLNDDKNLNIELQMRNQDFWPERSLLYWARTYDDLKSGDDYGNLKTTYHIGIIDFDIFPDNDELYSEYRIMNVKTGALYSDKFCTKVLNLKHIDNPVEADDKIIKWAKVIKVKTLYELEKLAGNEEVYKNMILELKKLSEDEKIRQQMEARADYDSRIATAKNAGLREGHKNGYKLKTLEVYNSCIAANMSKEDAIKISGIKTEDIPT